MLTEGIVAADNPFRQNNAATASIQLLAPAVMDVLHHMCRVEFFVEPVSYGRTPPMRPVFIWASLVSVYVGHVVFERCWKVWSYPNCLKCLDISYMQRATLHTPHGMLTSKVQAEPTLVQTVREALQYLSWENSDLSVKVLDAVSSVCKKGDVQSLYQLALVRFANWHPMTSFQVFVMCHHRQHCSLRAFLQC